MKSTSIVNNFFWRFAERCGAQIVTFIVSVVLARILAPEDYGQIALITVFTTIMQVFVDSGLGTALIQKKDADDLDFSSVFYFNFVVCLALYAIMFMAAPIIANFYKDLSLTPIIRVISLTIVSTLRSISSAADTTFFAYFSSCACESGYLFSVGLLIERKPRFFDLVG